MFFSHADENPDGWGVALLGDGRDNVIREERRADRSRRVRDMLSYGVRASNLIAHIRLATIGYDDLRNTHPFTADDISYRTWTLAHNGTVFESEPLTPYFYRQDGDTDSERILLYLTDCINKETENKGRALDAAERFEVIDRCISLISPRNKLNLLMYDGEQMYVHTNYRDSLYMRKDCDGSVIFATRALGGGDWERVPFTQLLAYRDGELLYRGTDHGNEYIPDECSINALYLAYSGL